LRVAWSAAEVHDESTNEAKKQKSKKEELLYIVFRYGVQHLQEGVLQMRKSRPYRRELYVARAALLQLPQTWPRVIGVHRGAQRCRQAVLFVRRHRPHSGGMPNFASTRLESKMLQLRPLWAYRARVSQRGTRVWLCVARTATWSRTEHGLAPTRQVLSLWWAEPYGA